MNIQNIITIISSFSGILLLALSFWIIYRTVVFFNFAHAVIYTAGAYLSFLFIRTLNWSLYTAIPIAIVLTLFLGVTTELLIFKTLRKKKSSSIVLLLASLGIYIVLQNLISLVLGDGTKSLHTWQVMKGIKIFEAYITPIQIAIITSSVLLLGVIYCYLYFAKTGNAMRAVAIDSELAKLSGVKSEYIILIAFAIGSTLAGIVGVLIALDVDMTPNMGMNMLLMGVVAMIIGGVGSIWGIVLGSLLLATAQNFAVWYISSQWMDATAFILLLIFLLFRPQGFTGKKIHKAKV